MEKRYIFLILLGLMAISFIFDDNIVFIVSGIKNVYLDGFFNWITYVASTVVIFIFMTTLFLWETKKREWILPLWISFLVTGAITLILKLIVDRARPFETLDLGVKLFFPGWNTSFPSWHAAAAFAGLAILDREFPNFKWFWVGFACLVAFSRLYLGVHYLSDVLAGVIIGYGIGLAIFNIESKKKYFRNFGKRFR